MGKSRETKTEQKIDPDLRKNTEANMGLARLFAQMGYQPYGGNDIAAFTPQQEASFDAANAASSAFGMPTADWRGSTRPATMDGSGIMGYSTHDVMRNEIGEDRYTYINKLLSEFADQAAGNTGAEKKSSGSGTTSAVGSAGDKDRYDGSRLGIGGPYGWGER